MFPIRDFEARFREILERMDELRDGAGELNANFEDALFVIECTGADDEDWREALSDALDEFEDLCVAYRGIEGAVPGLAEAAGRLEMAVQLARANL